MGACIRETTPMGTRMAKESLHGKYPKGAFIMLIDDFCRPDGRKYDGGWKKGKQNGEGLYTTRT